MNNLSSTELLLCSAIAIAFLVSSYFFNKYTKKKLAEHGQLENFQKRRWTSTITTGALFLGVSLYSLPNLPPGNEPILGFMVALSLGIIGYGLYQRWKARN